MIKKTRTGAKGGRPKGSGAGYVPLGVRVLPEVRDEVEKAAEERGVGPGVVAREVITRWAGRRAKGGAR
jgi:hypothetical protein